MPSTTPTPSSQPPLPIDIVVVVIVAGKIIIVGAVNFAAAIARL